MSGFSTQTRQVVVLRSGGMCERCGRVMDDWTPFSVHHRRPRGMGGDKSPTTNSALNGLNLCGSGTTGCHGWVETHRAEALDLGLLVSRYANPAEVPVLLAHGWVFLDAFGNYIPTEGPHR